MTTLAQAKDWFRSQRNVRMVDHIVPEYLKKPGVCGPRLVEVAGDTIIFNGGQSHLDLGDKHFEYDELLDRLSVYLDGKFMITYESVL